MIANISKIFWTFSVLAKTLRRCCLKSNLFFHMNVWWLSEYGQKAIQLLAEKSRQACLKCNLDSRRKISREKRLFWKKKYMFLFIVFGLPAKFFQNFGETIPAQLSQLHFTRPWEEHEQNYIFEENNFNFYFQKYSRKIRPFVKKNSRLVKTAFSMSWGTFWGKIFLWKD